MSFRNLTDNMLSIVIRSRRDKIHQRTNWKPDNCSSNLSNDAI